MDLPAEGRDLVLGPLFIEYKSQIFKKYNKQNAVSFNPKSWFHLSDKISLWETTKHTEYCVKKFLWKTIILYFRWSLRYQIL